jgi:hypothetical protein
MHQQDSALASQLKTPRTLSRRDIGLGLGLWLAAVLASGCATNPTSYDELPYNKRVTEIAQKVGGAWLYRTQPWRAQVIPSETLTVAYRESDIIGLSSALLHLCENDGQIAAVLVFGMISARSRYGGFDLGMAPPLSGSEDLYNTKTSKTFGAGYEAAVDVKTVHSLAGAGYDPRDVFAIWKKIGRYDANSAGTHTARLTAIKTELRKMGYQD